MEFYLGQKVIVKGTHTQFFAKIGDEAIVTQLFGQSARIIVPEIRKEGCIALIELEACKIPDSQKCLDWEYLEPLWECYSKHKFKYEKAEQEKIFNWWKKTIINQLK